MGKKSCILNRALPDITVRSGSPANFQSPDSPKTGRSPSQTPDFYHLKKGGKNPKKYQFLKKNFENFFLDFFLIFFPIFSSDKSPASGKENVRFLVSPDFENLPDFRTGQ